MFITNHARNKSSHPHLLPMLLPFAFVAPSCISITPKGSDQGNVGLAEAMMAQWTLLVNLKSPCQFWGWLTTRWRGSPLVIYGHHHATRKRTSQTPRFWTPKSLPAGGVAVKVDIVHASNVMFQFFCPLFCRWLLLLNESWKYKHSERDSLKFGKLQGKGCWWHPYLPSLSQSALLQFFFLSWVCCQCSLHDGCFFHRKIKS